MAAVKSIYYRSPYQQIFVKEIKTPLARALNTLTNPGSSSLEKARAIYSLIRLTGKINELPEPTIENTRQPSVHTLIGIRDEFFQRLRLPPILTRILRAIINFPIMVLDTDFYRSFILWWLWEIKKSEWPPLGPLQPDPHFWDVEEKST